MSDYNKWVATIVANLIGSLIFVWVDKFIFKNTVLAPLWEIQEDIKCSDCGEVSKGFRLVKTKNYDRTNDKDPQFRCEKCSKNKLQELKDRGVKL